MTLPAPRNPSGTGGLVPFEPRVDEGDLRIAQVIAMLKRSKWLILACVALAYAAAAIYVRRADRVYRATVSLQVEEKQSNMPDVLRNFSQSPDVNTDMEVLGSRTLVEDATRILGLQVRLITPREVSRDLLVDQIQATEDAPWGIYVLERQADSSFLVRDEERAEVAQARAGEKFSLPGVTLRLKPDAMEYPEIKLRVQPFADAVAYTDVQVGRAGKDADVLKVWYEDTDAGLVWRVPNVVANRFIERRQEAKKVVSRGQAKFLREQIDTLLIQLAGSEEQLKNYRERYRVVDPEVEASSRINRLVSLQAERGSLEAERSALASLLEAVEARHKTQAPGKPSVYRELLAFPSLLRNQAASQLLSSLAQVEDQRATLLTRRTEADPDVQLLSARITELETQLRTLAIAYLQGLSNQVQSLDTEIGRFGGQLNQLPRKELEFARLERKPQVLKEMYTLLQTRLKEAEIAEAAVNSSVSIVDPALPPRNPIRPNAGLITLMGLAGGILLGVGIALAREYTDRSIKTRSDATAASGLPVLAIVPRIRRQSQRPAVIARRSTAASPKTLPTNHRQPPVAGTGYTFLSNTASHKNGTSEPTASTESRAVISTHAPAQMSLSRTAGPVAEAYAILQTNIAFSRPDQHIKILALTSALPGEGKTTTAVNLALTLCQRGLSVCLIDADLRRPQLHEVFHVPREPGLSEVLAGLQTFDGAYRPVQIDEGHDLAVLTAGSTSGSAPALVGSARMGTLLTELGERFDLVIVDTPPVNILTDAALIGVNADAVIVVVRAGSTDGAALGYAVEQLNHVRAPALGIVLNDIDLKRLGGYDGAYRYYTYSAYTDSSPRKG